MSEQKIKYVVKKKGTKTYWCTVDKGGWSGINKAKGYSIDEKVDLSEELIALYPDGKKEKIR
jgi:hypothetical protein